MAHTSVQEAYMLGRGYKESARLHLQHWMWGQRLGWQLHPQIVVPEEGLNVVDVGCGNACWLLELARQKPKALRLHGLDNSTANFPAKEYLPSNMTLQQCDVFATIPEELCGQFDVVHVRAFSVVVKSGDPNSVAANLVKLLKPSGYLQWDEFDCASFNAHAPNPQISAAKAVALLDRWQSFAKKSDLKFAWVSDLPGLLRTHGLVTLDNSRLPISNDLRKPSTDDFVMALEEIGRLASNRDSELVGTPQEWEASFHGLVEEVGRGVTISMDMVAVLGKAERRRH